MKVLWLLILGLAVVPLAGCDALAAMYSAALWVSGLFLVIIIWMIAIVAMKVRGS